MLFDLGSWALGWGGEVLVCRGPSSLLPRAAMSSSGRWGGGISIVEFFFFEGLAGSEPAVSFRSLGCGAGLRYRAFLALWRHGLSPRPQLFPLGCRRTSGVPDSPGHGGFCGGNEGEVCGIFVSASSLFRPPRGI